MTRRVSWNFGADRFATSFLEAEGRLGAAMGEREAAIRAYSRYLALRRNAEPELQGKVDRVRAELEALTGG